MESIERQIRTMKVPWSCMTLKKKSLINPQNPFEEFGIVQNVPNPSAGSWRQVAKWSCWSACLEDLANSSPMTDPKSLSKILGILSI